jgi:hypothetical protein
MLFVYTIFTLSSASSVDNISIRYRIHHRPENSSFNTEHINSTIEIIVYQLPNRSFADIYYYTQVAGGAVYKSESHQQSYTITSPWLEAQESLRRFSILPNLVNSEFSSAYRFEHLGTETSKA